MSNKFVALNDFFSLLKHPLHALGRKRRTFAAQINAKIVLTKKPKSK
jgi:hypothetical protein